MHTPDAVAPGSADADGREISGRSEFWLVVALVVASLLVRLPFLSHNLFESDPVNYAWGALTIGVAHPPGYAGYCALGRVVNWFIHDINRSFVWINLTFALAAIVACYLLARRIGMGVTAAFITAASFSCSINLLFYAANASNHTAEAFCATLFALLAVTAIQTRRLSVGLAATIVLAAAGALRPTTTMFLAPLWLFMVTRSSTSLGRAALHFVVAAPIVLGWNYWNNYLMDKAGFGGTTYDVQVMMPAGYEYATLSANGPATDQQLQPSYHMPAFEILAWVQRKLHVKLLPHDRNWPAPNLARALKLCVVQGAKLAYSIVFSAPIVVVYLLVLLLNRRAIYWPPRWMRWFFALWFLPATFFFVFGHLGALGYMQVFLSGIIVFCCFGLLGVDRVVQAAGPGPEAATPSPARWRRVIVLAPAVASLLFFVLGRPLHATGGKARMIDLVLLQYTGAAVREGYATSRAAGGSADQAQVPAAIRNARSDEELLAVLRAMNFTPSPIVKTPTGATTQPAHVAPPPMTDSGR